MTHSVKTLGVLIIVISFATFNTMTSAQRHSAQ